MRISDWSSDVCSSDLDVAVERVRVADVRGVEERQVVQVRVDQVGAVARHHGRVVRAGQAGDRAHRVAVAVVELEGVEVAQHHDAFGRVGDLAPLDQVGEEARLLLRSEEHTSELQSLMRISYAVFCLKKKKSEIYSIHPLST